ncbi:MAG TPA: ABC transporter ATP-binding protein [Bacteroidia bacterium]|nr:ABC transporter ATP-binding protein [Bacteroidia bacterium]
MLDLKDINIGYTDKVVQRRITLSVGSGQFIALAGNNGCGKSTLLKTICGVIPPLSGTILINGKNYTELSASQLASQVAVVLTEKISGFNLKAFDVVASGRIPYLNSFGFLTEEDKWIVQSSMNSIGILELSSCLYDELSDGQKQKVLIAKALAQQTSIILMDEPTAFLDYKSRVGLFTLLKQLSKVQGKTIVISSHDIDIMFKHVDKVIYFNESGYQFGEPDKLYDEVISK